MHGRRDRARKMLLAVVSGAVLCSAGAVDRQKQRAPGDGWKLLEVHGDAYVGTEFWLFDPRGRSAWMENPDSSAIPGCRVATMYETDAEADSTYTAPEGVWITLSN